MEWTKEIPPDGTWCWVYAGNYVDPLTKEESRPVFLAKRDSVRAGGWTNDDTWEDFDQEVQCWIPLKTPDPPV